MSATRNGRLLAAMAAALVVGVGLGASLVRPVRGEEQAAFGATTMARYTVVQTEGHNLIGVGDGNFWMLTDQFGSSAQPLDPKLFLFGATAGQALIGPTPYLAPRPGSPTVDAGGAARPVQARLTNLAGRATSAAPAISARSRFRTSSSPTPTTPATDRSGRRSRTRTVNTRSPLTVPATVHRSVTVAWRSP